MSDVYDDEDLFEPAKSEFPAKEDLKDRLVVIYPTGKSGMRKSAVPGAKDYPWVETITVVIDDGPDGLVYTDLVPLVNETEPGTPVVLRNFQWSAGGIFSRIDPKRTDPKVPGTVGRINSRPNSKKGLADAWSISTPSDDEMAIARKYVAVLRGVRDEIKAARQQLEDEAAF